MKSLEGKPELPKESSFGNTHYFTDNGITYDVYKLIPLAESLPTEILPISVFKEELESNCWTDAHGNRMGPHSILRALEHHGQPPNWDDLVLAYPEWKQHIKQTRSADYRTYPILLMHGNIIADGMHRLTRATVEGATEILAKRFETIPEEAIARIEKSDTV